MEEFDFIEGKLHVVNTDFNEGFVRAQYGMPGEPVIIDNCVFNNQTSYAYPLY